ncbi:MAG: hypothetical protein ACXQS2_00990 [Methermicoccaceae archaeon]
MPQSIFGRIEELAPAELATAGFGVFLGALGHMVGESVFDGFFKERYPENYMLYSTAATSAILVPAALGAYFYGRRPGWEFLQYVAGGIFLSEIVQLLDLIRVTFQLRA